VEGRPKMQKKGNRPTPGCLKKGVVATYAPRKKRGGTNGPKKKANFKGPGRPPTIPPQKRGLQFGKKKKKENCKLPLCVPRVFTHKTRKKNGLFRSKKGGLQKPIPPLGVPRGRGLPNFGQQTNSTGNGFCKKENMRSPRKNKGVGRSL